MNGQRNGQRNESLIENISMNEAEVSSLVEKYDQESRYRRLSGWQGKFVTFWLAAMSLFHLYTAGITAMPITIQRAIHLTFAIVAVYVLYPATRRGDKLRAPWYDWLLAAAAGGAVGYIAVFFNEIARRGAEPLGYEIFLGVAAILLVIEAGRRVVGLVLPCLSVLFLLYCYFGYYAPGMFQIRGYSLNRIIQHMYLTSEGIFGLALGVSSTFVIVFIIFGAYLSRSGGAKFARWRKPGRPRQGRRRRLGAARHYKRLVGRQRRDDRDLHDTANEKGRLRAALRGRGRSLRLDRRPADAAHHGGRGRNVHIRARRDHLEGIRKEELPVVREVMKRDGHLLIPVLVIVVALLMKYTPLKAGFIGVVSVMVVSSFRKHTRMSLRDNVEALAEGARGALGVALACALVGFIVGTSSLTSLGLTISNNIIEISGGSLILTLVMAMFACLVLGMGLPTTANYIVCSTIIAPALAGMGVMPLAAHLFVFYFGIMADLTPPVCLAAFTGAGIAGASPAKTGVTATKIALASYLLPYCFVYNPMLLLQNVQPVELAVLVLSAVLGVVALAGALEGWFCRDLRSYERVFFGLCALAAIHPNMAISCAAIVGIVAAVLYFKKTDCAPAAEVCARV